VATIKDVASKAGVSISTVSYALSGTRPISAEKKELIEKAMKDLDYRPHAIARSLASKHTRIIAMMFPPVERGIGLSELSLITNAAKEATKRGYHLVLWSLVSNNIEEIQELTRQELVDGVLLMEVRNNDPRIPLLQKLKVPFILFGRDDTAQSESFVDTDFSLTMYKAFTYLTELEHRKICFINQSEATYLSGYGPVFRSHDAFQTFAANFKASGHAVFCNPCPSAGYETAKAILAAEPETTAFILMNDNALSGVIKAVEESGRKIPENVSIVSLISSAATASMLLPSITTFEMESHTLMELAIGQLIARLEDSYFEVPQRLIPCTLAERKSSGRAPSAPSAPSAAY
jgi:DNA-binding LacI/PurR family transcriptional regulator